MQEIELNGSQVFVLPVIKGPVSDGEKVRTAIMDIRPDAVGISISKEELEGLRAYQGEEIELSDLEEAYKAGLSEFGEVQLPPPCYLEALKACDELGVPIIPIDMNEDLFSDRYCELVGGFELMKESFFSHRIARKRFNLESAEAFVLDYDRKVNGGRGLSALNAEREAHMARTAEEMAGGRSRVLLLLELERADGVKALLTEGRGR
jgi:pheromone shutdown protein TraB